MEITYVSINRYMDKEYVTHTQRDIILLQEEGILSFEITWMDLDMIILVEVSQIKKAKYHMISLIYRI